MTHPQECHIVVVIPTYNERDNIVQLTDRLLKLALPLNILFVDDASPDGTGQQADVLAKSHSQVAVIHRRDKRGYASAVLDGFREALKGSYSHIMVMDADLSHDPAAIPSLLQAAPGRDLVLGSRYLGGLHVIDWEMSRVLLSLVANRYARIVAKIPCSDITTGFRCYSRTALGNLDFTKLRASGYSFNIEIAYHIWKSGGRLAEVPIIFYGRKNGVTKMTKRMIVEAVLLVWRLRFGFGRSL